MLEDKFGPTVKDECIESEGDDERERMLRSRRKRVVERAVFEDDMVAKS